MTLREAIRDALPYFLSEGGEEEPNVAWRMLWALTLQADAFLDWATEGSRAALPGLGTPTALAPLGRSRNIQRGRIETDASYAARLVDWLELHRDRGKMYGIAREVQHYLGAASNGLKYEVRLVNRTGTWGILAASGAWTFLDPGAPLWAWDWDSVSNPERGAKCPADMWVVIVPSPSGSPVGPQVYADVPAWTVSTTSWGHEAPQVEVMAIRGLLSTWKAARTRIVAVIWGPATYTGDPVLDPRSAASWRPNGTWGKWGLGTNGPRTPSRPAWLRFWE